MVNCIQINAIDVRLLNFSIRTSVDQVMALLPRSCKLGQVRSARPVQVSSAGFNYV